MAPGCTDQSRQLDQTKDPVERLGIDKIVQRVGLAGERVVGRQDAAVEANGVDVMLPGGFGDAQPRGAMEAAIEPGDEKADSWPAPACGRN